MDKENLKTFIKLLKTVKRQPNDVFDLGLVIKEPNSDINVGDFFEAAKKEAPVEKVSYDESSADDEVADKLIKIFKRDKWAFLEIKKDISSPFLNQLQHLANDNSLRLIDYKEKDLFEMKMSENSRVIVFSEREFIENKITYPHFYRLFGPTLSLE